MLKRTLCKCRADVWVAHQMFCCCVIWGVIYKHSAINFDDLAKHFYWHLASIATQMSVYLAFSLAFSIRTAFACNW